MGRAQDPKNGPKELQLQQNPIAPSATFLGWARVPKNIFYLRNILH